MTSQLAESRIRRFDSSMLERLNTSTGPISTGTTPCDTQAQIQLLQGLDAQYHRPSPAMLSMQSVQKNASQQNRKGTPPSGLNFSKSGTPSSVKKFTNIDDRIPESQDRDMPSSSSLVVHSSQRRLSSGSETERNLPYIGPSAIQNNQPSGGGLTAGFEGGRVLKIAAVEAKGLTLDENTK